MAIKVELVGADKAPEVLERVLNDPRPRALGGAEEELRPSPRKGTQAREGTLRACFGCS